MFPVFSISKLLNLDAFFVAWSQVDYIFMASNKKPCFKCLKDFINRMESLPSASELCTECHLRKNIKENDNDRDNPF